MFGQAEQSAVYKNNFIHPSMRLVKNTRLTQDDYAERHCVEALITIWLSSFLLGVVKNQELMRLQHRLMNTFQGSFR